eukprot:COSAG02_NODE_58588_length_277_cov_0.561798_1_plen_31_part_01
MIGSGVRLASRSGDRTRARPRRSCAPGAAAV